MRFIPLTLIVFGLVFALVAALRPVSRFKGQARLFSSLLVGGAFFIGGFTQIRQSAQLWPGSFGVLAGLWLAWIGWRKFERDPDGKTSASKML